MKILYLDVNYDFSSTGKIVKDLQRGMGKLGHSTIACFGRGKGSSVLNVIKISTGIEVAIHALASRLTGYNGRYSFLSTARFIDIIHRFQPDIVHLHDIHGYFINIPLVATYLKSSGIPTVWTFHCEYMYTGKCGYALECEQWKTICLKCPQLRSYPSSWFFDNTSSMFIEKARLFRNFRNLRLVAPSNWLANRMRQSPVLKDLPISVVPNGLSIDVFSPGDRMKLRSQYGVGNRFTVLSVGSNIFSQLKGGRWILEIASRLPDFLFIIVGANSVCVRSLPFNIRLVGSVSDPSVLSGYFSLADAFLLTSLKETFSMVCAESLACGTPVFGFNSGAPSEVAPTGYGQFVDYGDVDSLILQLRLFHAGCLQMKNRTECRDFATRSYSSDIMVDNYHELYAQALSVPS